MAVQRTFYQDGWNKNKVWEVAKLARGYYLRQYICGKQWGRGVLTTKKFIQSIGIFELERVGGIEV